MKIVITVKDTDNVIGLKEDIAMRLEGVADIVRIDTADVAPKSEVEYLKEHLEIWCEKYKKAIEKNDVLTDKCEVLYNELLVERCKNAKLFEELEYFSNDERFIKSQWYAELKKKYTEDKR